MPTGKLNKTEGTTNGTNLVKHFKQFGTGLVNGADDGSTTECKRL